MIESAGKKKGIANKLLPPYGLTLKKIVVFSIVDIIDTKIIYKTPFRTFIATQTSG